MPSNKISNNIDLSLLKKVELHLHLDCSLSFEVVSRIKPSITREEYEQEFTAPAKCTNLADFLKRAPKGINLMQTENELRLVTEDLFHQLQRDNVLYAEIRFAPLQHTGNGLRPEEVVKIVEDAASKASEATGIETRLILCTLRHFTEEQSLQTVQLVERFRGTRVAALDIAADEAGFPIDAHIPAFRYAIDRNIPRTAHAGEASGPESVWETLKYLRPSRIGHGVPGNDPDMAAINDTAVPDPRPPGRGFEDALPFSAVPRGPYVVVRERPVSTRAAGSKPQFTIKLNDLVIRPL